MEEPVSTPQLPKHRFWANKSKSLPQTTTLAAEQILSSSPGFGTPAFPLANRPAGGGRQLFENRINTDTTTAATVLPILLPPQTLRPIAFRTLTKRHNLTLTSSGLGLLSTFVGKFCGSGWREEGLAERVLDEFAKQWKRCGGGVVVEDGPDKKLSAILKTLEPCMSAGRVDAGRLSRTNSAVGGSTLSRTGSFADRPVPSRDDSQTSLGLTKLGVDDNAGPDEDEVPPDARPHLSVISAFSQPRLVYSTAKKSFEPGPGNASLLPPIQHKILMFRNRYQLVHQRIMRNEKFQAPALSTARPPKLHRSGSSAITQEQFYKLTSIQNLLGRSGTSHLLLGMLTRTPTGTLALTDLTGSVALDMTACSAIPDNRAAWYAPGMVVLVEGSYEEDGSNSVNLGSAAGIGGLIKGVFNADVLSSPPAERRSSTLGLPDSTSTINVSGYGWIDFLGTGSEKALGNQMRRLQSRLFNPPSNPDADLSPSPPRTRVAILGQCTLDAPLTLEAIRAVLTSYASDPSPPLSIVFMGSFSSKPCMAGTDADSVAYKESFDALAGLLSDFNDILSVTTLVFVPGDNDPWASSFSAGGASLLPRQGVPELFSTRVRRAVTAANNERRDGGAKGEAVFTSNPARLSLFGPVAELVLFRDDISSRMRRHAITLAAESADIDADIDADANADGTLPSSPGDPDATTATASASSTAAKRLVKTLLDQSHLAPFPQAIRPVSWDHAASLSLYPLPSGLVLCDAEMAPFALTYEGCVALNAGRLCEGAGTGGRGRVGRWVEYDFKARSGECREVRF